MNLVWWRSLRARITIVATGVTLVMLLVVAGSLLVAQQRQLDAAVDAALQDSVDDAQLELGVSFRAPRGRSRPINREALRLLAANSQLIRANGVVEISTGDLQGRTAIIAPEVLFSGGATGDFLTVAGQDGERFRVAATPVGNNFALVVGYSMADVDESQRALRRSLLVLLPLLAGLLGLLIWVITGRALQPVESMRSEVDAISSKELHTRLTTPDTTELSKLAATLNSMLDRIQGSVEAQQRFVADASHELRSPLTGIRSQLEVNIAHPRAPGRSGAEQDMLAETIRMQALVEDLLVLARSDQDGVHIPMENVDLDDLVLSEVSSQRNASECSIDAHAVSAAQVMGNADQLRRVVRNVLSNAVRHCEFNVSVSLSESGGLVSLVVEDDGPGVPEHLRERIFERFTRSDEARDRDSGGSGLGLAISRAILENHGGTITLQAADSRGARFVIKLPVPRMAPGF